MVVTMNAFSSIYSIYERMFWKPCEHNVRVYLSYKVKKNSRPMYLFISIADTSINLTVLLYSTTMLEKFIYTCLIK